MVGQLLKTPVVLVIFKRPETTERVLAAICRARPSQLFVVADGARRDRPGEAEKCEATRDLIEKFIDQLDWPCQVLKNYSDINLGCGKRLPTGLDWVFEQVDEAIILEDDCVPHPSFFPFCEDLLDYYRDDERVASISGQNVQFGRNPTPYDYYFSRYNHCWGWATWKRSWQHFDWHLKQWPEVRDRGLLESILVEPELVRYWTKIFQKQYDGRISTVWDYQWTFACWIRQSLGIISSKNLISNIGFGTESTHFTLTATSQYADATTEAMGFPLQHPPYMIRHGVADRFTHRTLFHNSLSLRVRAKVIKALRHERD